MSVESPEFVRFGGNVGVGFFGTDPVEMVPAKVGVRYRVTQVSLQVIGLYGSDSDFNMGRLAVWFGEEPAFIIHSIEFEIPPTRPAISIYPDIWTCSEDAPNSNMAIKTGYLIDGPGGTQGGELPYGRGRVRILYEKI